MVRNKLNLCMRYWFVEAEIVFCMCLDPYKGSKYYLETVKTIFSENNNYYRAIFVKLNFFFMPEKCIISGVKYQSKFWPLRRKLAVIFLKWLFFENSLVISWATWPVKMQVKEKNIFQNSLLLSWPINSVKVQVKE